MNRSDLIPLILSALFFVLLTVAYVFGYRFFLAEQLRAGKLDTTISEKSAEVDRIASAKHTLVSLAGDEATIQQYFVTVSDIVPFLGGLEATGKSLGSTVEVVSVTPDTTPGGRSHLSLAVRITGSFDAVMRTLGSIEYAPYDITLANLTLDAQTTQNGKGPANWTAAATFSLGTHSATSTKP